MRKIICLIFGCYFAFMPITFAVNSNIDTIPVWSQTIEVFNQIENKVELKLNSEAAILMDEDTGTILYTKNEHKKLRPASVTKVMTLLLIMEALETGTISLTDNVPCSSRASAMPPARTLAISKLSKPIIRQIV